MWFTLKIFKFMKGFFRKIWDNEIFWEGYRKIMITLWIIGWVFILLGYLDF
jgi:hypothetical protein